MTDALERVRHLLSTQGYVPLDDELGASGVQHLLEDYFTHVGSREEDIAAMTRQAIVGEGRSWAWGFFPARPEGAPVREVRGWVCPQDIYRGLDEFPKTQHGNLEDLAEFAAADLTDRGRHERLEDEGIGLWVSRYPHWAGHVFKVADNGRHRSAVFRARQVPLVRASIRVVEVEEPFPLHSLWIGEWDDDTDKVFSWMEEVGLIRDYTHPHEPGDAASCRAPADSPVPWLAPLGIGQLTGAALPGLLAELEKRIGPITDPRFDLLRHDLHQIRARPISEQRARALRAQDGLLATGLRFPRPEPERPRPRRWRWLRRARLRPPAP